MKKAFRFKKIDAFATDKSSGNPAGTVWLDSRDDITEDEMLQISRELKRYVSEVGFIHKIAPLKYGLKYFSSKREVNFCGHATIAMMHELFSTELKDETHLTIVTNDGELQVENRLKEEQAVFIMSPRPFESVQVPDREDIAEHLIMDPDMMDQTLPVKVIHAGLNTLIVPVKNLEAVLEIQPDLNDLYNFCMRNQIDIVELFTKQTAREGHDYRVRVFAATFGYLEDPATGSGNSAFGYYLLKQGLWSKETLVLEQNKHLESFNIIKLQKTKDKEGCDRIIFGGGALKRIDGEFILY